MLVFHTSCVLCFGSVSRLMFLDRTDADSKVSHDKRHFIEQTLPIPTNIIKEVKLRSMLKSKGSLHRRTSYVHEDYCTLYVETKLFPSNCGIQ